MPEETTVADVEETKTASTGMSTETSGHYTEGEGYADVSVEAKETVAKHETPAQTVKAYAELSKKLGSDFRLPDDLKSLSADQRADLITKTRTLRDIPETAEGYEITVADGIPRDEPAIAALKAMAFEKGWSREDVQAMADMHTNILQGAFAAQNKKIEEDYQTAQTEYRMHCGSGYKQRLAEIDITREQLAKDLHLGYSDETGARSKLDDALDMLDANGRKLGNQIPINQLLNFIYDKLYKESNPVEGSLEPGMEAGGALSPAFYAHPTK